MPHYVSQFHCYNESIPKHTGIKTKLKVYYLHDCFWTISTIFCNHLFSSDDSTSAKTSSNIFEASLNKTKQNMAENRF